MTTDDKLKDALAVFGIVLPETFSFTEEEAYIIHERKEAIWQAVHDLVDTMTFDLPEKLDIEIRDRLTDEFRFWKR